MTSICAGIKRDGGRCTQSVRPGVEWCHNHDPGRAEARRRSASRAGKSRPSTEVARIKTDLQEMVDAVLAGELDRGRASICGQLLNTKLRCVEVERRSLDMADLLSRLEHVEEAAAKLRGA